MPQPTRHGATRKPRPPARPRGRSGKPRRPAAVPARPRPDSTAYLPRNPSALALAGVVLGVATGRRWILLPALAAMLVIIGETIGARQRG